MTRTFWLKLFISVAAIIFIAVRIIWPELNIDAITLGLLIVAVLPWLTPLIESAKFPGGWEVKFRDVQAAGQRIIQDVSVSTIEPTTASLSYLEISDRDPNLALVGLRIEIEKRLRALAQKHGLSDQRSLSRFSQDLIRQGVLDSSSVSGLQELIMFGNQAAHGAKVEDRAAEWAIDYGPQVLAALDSKLGNQLPPT